MLFRASRVSARYLGKAILVIIFSISTDASTSPNPTFGRRPYFMVEDPSTKKSWTPRLMSDNALHTMGSPSESRARAASRTLGADLRRRTGNLLGGALSDFWTLFLACSGLLGYLSDHWLFHFGFCPCRRWTPVLSKFYSSLPPTSSYFSSLREFTLLIIILHTACNLTSLLAM